MDEKQKSWKKLIKPLVFIVIGGLLGFLYYWKVGCVTGSCPITSDPLRSILYGAVFGFLLSVIFSKPAVRNDGSSG